MYDEIKSVIEIDIEAIESQTKDVSNSSRMEIARLITYQNRVLGKIYVYGQLTGNKKQAQEYYEKIKETGKNMKNQLGSGFFLRLDQVVPE